MDIKYALIIVLHETLLSPHAERISLICKKKKFLFFLKIVVGTFCATCTITGYHCYYIIILMYII